jgi:hypothetical protein
VALPTNTTKVSQGPCEYHDDTHPATTTTVKGVSIAVAQVRQTQLRTRRSSKWETSGRLGTFMLQISRDKNVKNNNKTYNKELVKNNKRIQPRVTCATRHARNTCCMINAENWMALSRATRNKHELQRQQQRQKLPSSF